MLKQKIKQLFSSIFKNMFTTNITISVLLVLIVSLYLSQINTTTHLGLDAQVVEKNLIESREKKRDLQLEVAEYQSIVHLQDRIADMGLVQVGQVAYISVAVPVTAVAKR